MRYCLSMAVFVLPQARIVTDLFRVAAIAHRGGIW